MDVNEKAKELLAELANSIYDRNPEKDFYFTKAEIEIVERWLEDFLSSHARDTDTITL